MDASEIVFDADSATQTLSSPIATLRLEATNIRRERTGIHARVCVYSGGNITYDQFNLDRREDRLRLTKDAWGKEGDLVKVAVPLLDLGRAVDIFCAAIFRDWEASQYTGEYVTGMKRAPGNRFLLRPYCLRDGGTIFFAPGGSGKSWLFVLMALSIQHGLKLFPVNQTDIYLVNLERSADSLKHRVAVAKDVLGLSADAGLYMLNARGQSLSHLTPSIRHGLSKLRNPHLMVDSLSRSGAGSMVADDTSNAIIDTLSQLSPGWSVIGHTPRPAPGQQADHVYGSVMFENGEDIGVQLASERRGNTLGISLTVRKVNDGPFPPVAYYMLSFSEPDENGESDLNGFRTSSAREFPELASLGTKNVAERLKDYAEAEGRINPSGAAKDLDANRGYINSLLRGPDYQPDGPPDKDSKQWYIRRFPS